MLDLSNNFESDDLSQANEVIRELVQLNENAEKEKLEIKRHYEAQIRYIKELYRRRVSEMYGPSSEAAKALFNEAEHACAITSADSASCEDGATAADPTAPTPKTSTRRKKRKVLPDHLPREVIVHDLEDAAKVCPHDGSVLVKVGEDVREEVCVRPAKFFVKQHVTPKYGCPKCHEGVHCACVPKRIIPGSVASPSILANLIVSKYVDHLPLYRQEEVFKRHQIEITRATMARWIIQVSEALQPLVNLIKDEILDGPMVQCDETPLVVLKKDGVHLSRKNYMWVMGRPAGPPGFPAAVLYELGPGRGGDVAHRLLGDYGGFVQTDGLKSYDQLYVSKRGRRLGCMAHVRRKFVTVLKSLAKDKRSAHPASHAVKLIAKLYAIEEELREAKKTNSEAISRSDIRGHKASPIFAELESYIAQELVSTGSQSPYGMALNYASEELPKIKLYLSNDDCEIDNNWIENMIRPFALGRKNWLFSDTDRGADASAVIYTIVQSAKINGINPAAYVESILERIPSCENLEDYDALLPWKWRQ